MRDLSLPLPVDRVTLSEDRAQVTRAGVIKLPRGSVRLRIEDVSPVIADKSLLVRAPAGVAVTDVRVERTLRTRATDRPEASRELMEQRRAIGRECQRLEEELALIDGQLERLDAAAKLACQELSDDAARARLESAHLEVSLAGLQRAEGDLRLERVELADQLAEARRERDALDERLRVADRPDLRCGAALVLELHADRRCEAALEVDYVVPGAFWRPYHRARLILDAGSRVAFETEGCVWQNTGEDWPDVSLVFSTERPSLGASPPPLSADVLRARKADSAVHVESREQAIEVTGVDGGAGRSSQPPALPGIDDGGEPRILKAAVRASVPSDGRPHRVPIAAFEAPAPISRVAVPELSRAVFLRAELENTGEHPVLAGPVDLLRDSGYVGRTSTLFVSPGERMALSFGPEPELRLHREVDSREEPRRGMSSWSVVRHKVSLYLSNLGDSARSVEVTERIPVSEVEQVQVSFDAKKTTGAARSDDDGLVRWSVVLPPYGRKQVELVYTVRKHKDVVGI